MREPDDHEITISPNPHLVRVMLGGVILAETRRALTLREGARPAVQYIPRADVMMDLLEVSPDVSRSPRKGDAGYFTATAHGIRAKNVAWSYERPHDGLAEIAGFIAFDPNRVDAIEELN